MFFISAHRGVGGRLSEVVIYFVLKMEFTFFMLQVNHTPVRVVRGGKGSRGGKGGRKATSGAASVIGPPPTTAATNIAPATTIAAASSSTATTSGHNASSGVSRAPSHDTALPDAIKAQELKMHV